MKIKKALLIFALACFVSLLLWTSRGFNYESRFAFQGIIMLLIPIALAISFKLKKENLGLSLKLWKKAALYTIILLIVAVPGMLYASRMQEFQLFYPIFRALNLSQFIYFELLLLPLFLFLEFFYRGFILFQLKKYVGNWAILLQTIPYTLIHWGKPMPELYYSFFAGLIFAYVCIKAKSFLPGFFSHYISSVIFDWLCW